MDPSGEEEYYIEVRVVANSLKEHQTIISLHQGLELIDIVM